MLSSNTTTNNNAGVPLTPRKCKGEAESDARNTEDAVTNVWVLPRRWVANVIAERDWLEDQNARLADRVGMLQLQVQHERELRRLCEESNRLLLAKLSSAVRHLRRVSAVNVTAEPLLLPLLQPAVMHSKPSSVQR